MPRIARYICALIFCFVVMAIAVYAFDARVAPTVSVWRQDMAESYYRNTREQGLDIRGRTPTLRECFGPSYAALNEDIEAAVDSMIESTRRLRARSITFDYEIFATAEVISVVIHATTRAVTERASVTSINFDPHTGVRLTLTEAMGMDITPLAEGKIADMIRRDPATYYAAFSAPPTGQAFYITDNALVLLFDEFQLSSAPGAAREIVLIRDNIKFFTIAYEDYRLSQDRYGIMMMPLRQILLGMGYTDDDFVWDPLTKEATVMRNDRPMATLTAWENNFLLSGILQRSLEAAPELINGVMYVPISFFDQILGFTAYHIDEHGNVSFMSYLR